MKEVCRSWAFCAILLTALLLSGCGWAAGSDVAEVPDPGPTVPPVSPTQGDLEAVLWIPATLPDGDSVELEFTLTNSSEEDLYVLKWYTPLEGLGGEIFRVKRDGQPVPYEGPLAMRGDPTPDAYVFLEAGSSVSATVDLAAAYDFSKSGVYTISFLSPRISHVARTEAEMATSVDDLGPVRIPANEVRMTLASSSLGEG